MRNKNEKLTYDSILKVIKEKTECKLLTIEEEFNEQVNNGIKPSLVKICLRCHCDSEYETQVYKITQNKNPIVECDKCRRKKYKHKKINIKELNIFLKSYGLNITEEKNKSIDASTDINVKCLNGHIFSSNYTSLKKHHNCPYCNGTILTYEYIKQFIEKTSILLTTKEEFEEKSKNVKYINSDVILKIKCNHCDDFYLSTFQVYKARKYYLCEKCSDIQIKKEKLDKFKQEAIKIGHSVLASEYIDYFTPIKMRCSCEGIYFISKAEFDSGYKFSSTKEHKYCPNCRPSGSKGEVRIQEYLANKITFSKEYTFKNLFGINGGTVRYDFAIFNKENKLKYLIEYDGEQHFYPVNFGGMSNEEAFSRFINTVYNDSLKNSYCEDNNIPLLRIPYWDYDNIEQILEDNILLDLK